MIDPHTVKHILFCDFWLSMTAREAQSIERIPNPKAQPKMYPMKEKILNWWIGMGRRTIMKFWLSRANLYFLSLHDRIYKNGRQTCLSWYCSELNQNILFFQFCFYFNIYFQIWHVLIISLAFICIVIYEWINSIVPYLFSTLQ